MWHKFWSDEDHHPPKDFIEQNWGSPLDTSSAYFKASKKRWSHTLQFQTPFLGRLLLERGVSGQKNTMVAPGICCCNSLCKGFVESLWKAGIEIHRRNIGRVFCISRSGGFRAFTQFQSSDESAATFGDRSTSPFHSATSFGALRGTNSAGLNVRVCKLGHATFPNFSTNSSHWPFLLLQFFVFFGRRLKPNMQLPSNDIWQRENQQEIHCMHIEIWSEKNIFSPGQMLSEEVLGQSVLQMLLGDRLLDLRQKV